MSNEKLKGKKAIVTGGSRGIGRGVALTLAAAGADVAFCHHKDNDKAKETSSEIEKLGRKSFAAECDVSSTSSVKEFYANAVSQMGDIDILVNNAGHNITENFEEISEESFDRMLNVHVKGTFFMTQAVYKDMKKEVLDEL